MKWNSELAIFAQEWANHLAKIGYLKEASYSTLSDLGQGESVYFTQKLAGVISTCTDAVYAW